MPEFDRPTSDHPTVQAFQARPPHAASAAMAPGEGQRLSLDMPELEHDLEVLSWLVCSPQLEGEVTGYLCDALADWALAGHGYPQMAVPEVGADCDHLSALTAVRDRIPQRIGQATGVADKMDLGRLGQLLSRALWAADDPGAVRQSTNRELVTAMPWLTGPPAPYRLPGGGVL